VVVAEPTFIFRRVSANFNFDLIAVQGRSAQYPWTRRTEDASRNLEGGLGSSGGENPRHEGDTAASKSIARFYAHLF
jgi:hypothetical protein